MFGSPKLSRESGDGSCSKVKLCPCLPRNATCAGLERLFLAMPASIGTKKPRLQVGSAVRAARPAKSRMRQPSLIRPPAAS